MVGISQILPVTHYSSFTLDHLSFPSCILLSTKYILSIILLQSCIIYCVIHITYYDPYLLSFTFDLVSISFYLVQISFIYCPLPIMFFINPFTGPFREKNHKIFPLKISCFIYGSLRAYFSWSTIVTINFDLCFCVLNFELIFTATHLGYHLALFVDAGLICTYIVFYLKDKS